VRSGIIVNTINNATATVTETLQDERQHATMWGVQGGIWYRAAGKIFEQLDAYWESGDPNTLALVQRARQWKRYEVTGRLGATAGIGCCCSVLVTPYGGYGFRWFEDTFKSQSFVFQVNMTPVTVVEPQVRFTYQTYYVPLGGIITLNMGCLEIGLLGEYQAPVQTLLKLQVNNFPDPLMGEVRFRVPRHRAWLVELPIRAKLGPCCVQLEVGIVPFYKDESYGSVLVPNFFGPPPLFITVPCRRHLTAGARLEVGMRI
jgi:hypothetical protein